MSQAKGAIAAMIAAAQLALEDVAQQEVDGLREDLSIPVVRDENGNVVQRSSPGEAPRLETGQLKEGIHAEVFHDTARNESVARIISERVGDDVPQELELGTPDVAARPYMTPRLEEFSRGGLIRIADAIRDRLK